MSWVTRKDDLLKLAYQFDKSIKILTKDNWWSKLAAWFLFIITCGKMTREKFLQNTATCIGPLHFFPAHYDYRTVEWVEPHEARHTQQFRWLGLGIHPWVGLLPAILVYGFLPLPTMFAYGRFYMEVDADRASWRYKLENNLMNEVDVQMAAMRRAKSLAGPTYFWALRYQESLRRYQKAAAEVIDEYTKAKLG
jgi:hypothetical protein